MSKEIPIIRNLYFVETNVDLNIFQNDLKGEDHE
jgi:hypothetical protein